MIFKDIALLSTKNSIMFFYFDWSAILPDLTEIKLLNIKYADQKNSE